MSRSHQVGSNLTLAAVLAVLSYVPFEYVAKTSLLICVLLFVFDPFPPASRLVSLIATVVVGLLARAERNFRQQEQQLEEDLVSVKAEDSKEKSN